MSDQADQKICASAAARDGLPEIELKKVAAGANSDISDHLISQLQAVDLQVIALLGKGGMGSIYKVRNQKIDRLEAIKLVGLDRFDQREHLKRLQREAQAIGRLHHPNIVSVYGLGLLGDGCPYITMELLEGKSLKEYLDGHKKLTAQEFESLFLPVLDALSCAHSSGIIHRDLKPTNIFLENGDLRSPKIIDFGIAQADDNFGSQRLTKTGKLLGSPAYMSPEQCRGEKLDARADLYSLACVMFESLYGTTPYDSDNELEIMLKHASDETPRLPHNTGVPPHIESLLLSCLSKNREKRPSSAAEVMAALKSRKQLPRTSRRHRGLKLRLTGRRFALTGFMIVLAMAGIALITFSMRRQPDASPFADPDLNSDLPGTLVRKGESARALGQYDAAVKYFKAADQRLGEHDSYLRHLSLMNLGGVYADMGRYPESIAWINKAQKGLPHSMVGIDFVRSGGSIDLALTHQKFKNYDAARVAFQDTQRLINRWHPIAQTNDEQDKIEQQTVLYYYWGRLEDETNNLSEAKLLLEKTLEALSRERITELKRTSQIDARYRLAGINKRLGNFAEAKSLFEDVASLEGDRLVPLTNEELEMRNLSQEQALECTKKLQSKTGNTK